MATSTALVTVEEFRKLKDPPGVRLELHNGEVVEVGRANYRHWKVQPRLAAIFEAVFGNKGEAGTEFMYRPRLEFEFRVAEVAWLSRERAETIDLDDSLRGVPEIVVEVLSPSNSALEVLRKRELCFGSNCEQFWIIDTESKLIEIYLTGGAVCTYRPGERIPLGGTTIAVDDIFDF